MTPIIASGTTQIVIATGVGVVAIIVGGIGVVATLGQEDRGHLRTLLRHPVRTIFTEDEPDLDDD
jgi:hypothetical protein